MSKPKNNMNGKRHVVHVIGALNTGGAEKMLINFLVAADRERFRHTVICLTARGDMAEQVEAVDVQVVVFPVRMRRLPVDVARLADWFRREKVQIVHSHMFFASFWARLAGICARVPVLVTTEHGKEPWKKPWQSFVDRMLSHRTFHHIAVSDDVRSIRLRRDSIAPDKITLIPNGVPIPDPAAIAVGRKAIREEFGIAADTPLIGSVGRVIEAKAYPDLLQALRVARGHVPDLKWLQVGDGPEMTALIAQIERDGLQDAVVSAGRRNDVGAVLGAIDIWVMSSIREGLPVALLEAMAAGRPIVATRVGGIPDAVDDGAEALLVPEGHPEDIAAAILKLLTDPASARKIGQAARERAMRDYGIDAVTRRIEAIYDSGFPSA